MDKQLLSMLVCPLCKGKLKYDAEAAELLCTFDGLAFPVRDGVPVMLEGEGPPHERRRKSWIKPRKKHCRINHDPGVICVSGQYLPFAHRARRLAAENYPAWLAISGGSGFCRYSGLAYRQSARQPFHRGGCPAWL